MGFLLVPKSVTLNDLERRNGRVVCAIWPNSVVLRPYYVKVVEDTPTHSASEMNKILKSMDECLWSLTMRQRALENKV